MEMMMVIKELFFLFAFFFFFTARYVRITFWLNLERTITDYFKQSSFSRLISWPVNDMVLCMFWGPLPHYHQAPNCYSAELQKHYDEKFIHILTKHGKKDHCTPSENSLFVLSFLCQWMANLRFLKIAQKDGKSSISGETTKYM